MTKNTVLPKHAVIVIFAGGEGKRLWPISTKKLPKQMNPIFSKETLIKEAFDRALTIVPKENIVIVTTNVLAENTKKIIDLPDKNWVIQPKNADTAVAMCLTALHLETFFPESIAVLFYSDHKISKTKQFIENINDIISLAKKYPAVITIGTKIFYPNTQFGYIKLGEKKEKHFYLVDSFTEKPNEKTALEYMKSNQYVWNTGVYVWQTTALLDAVKKVSPLFYKELLTLRLAFGSNEYTKLLHDWFERVKPLSFDKAISEKLTNLFVYVADYKWDDIGNWETVYKISKKDKHGNALVGKQEEQSIKLINSNNCLVVPYQKEIGLIGVNNLIVVQTKNALLICNKKDVGKVKEIEK